MRGYKDREFTRMDDDGLPSIVQEIHFLPDLLIRVVYFDDTEVKIESPSVPKSQQKNPNWKYIYAEQQALWAYALLVRDGDTVGARGKQLYLL